MTKMRVHELAKEFDMTSKEMETKVKDLGYSIKNYMSTLEDYEVQDIRHRLKGETEAAETTEDKPKTVVRRRHQVIKLKKIVRPQAPQPPEEEVAIPVESENVAAETAPVEEPAHMEAQAPEAESPQEHAPVEAQAPPVETAAEPEQAPAAETEAASPEAEAHREEEPSAAPVAQPKGRVEKSQTAAPKSFVKIMERRIDLSETTMPQPEPQAQAPTTRPAARPTARPAPAGAGAQADLSAGGLSPDKKPKKKAKRVVHMGGEGQDKKRRGAVVKRKEKPKPLTKLLVEASEMTPAAAPEAEMTEMVIPTVGRQPKKRSAKAGAPTPTGTAPPKAGKRKIVIHESIQVGELAKRMGIKVSDVIKRLMAMGMMATANQAIDYDVASLVAGEFDYEIEKKAVAEDLIMEEVEGGEPQPRPPVVTVMGHVDHGKTTLLDAIRHADVVSKEAGGITQHIGAYHVTLPSGHEVVFLDTPGHEAFTAMRSRGAKVTDIVILVVAADDGVMAQTREAIDHARAAKVPIIVAVNKIDKPGANPDRVKSELAEYGLVPEDWGGDTIFVNISAKQNMGVEGLLEMLALQAELMELKADPDRPARGHVVEARLDKGRGPVTTLLISEGTLKIGDAVVAGVHHGKVRAMLNDKGERIESAGPAMPVEIQGLSGVPEAGNEFTVLPDEKKAREVADYRQMKMREAELAKSSRVSLESMFDRLKEQEVKELNIILKVDVQGSLEALSDALQKLTTAEIKVNIVTGGIGAITESDVLLASASDAIIIGFNVRPNATAKALAEQENVDIRFYDVIYHALEEVKNAMVGLLEPVYEEKVLGHAEVRDTFRVPKVGTVAGCHVSDGNILRNSKARLLRENVVIYTGKISSLRRFKEDVKEVQTGYECGIGLDRYNDIKVGDVIEAYTMEEVAAVLSESLADAAEAEK